MVATFEIFASHPLSFDLCSSLWFHASTLRPLKSVVFFGEASTFIHSLQTVLLLFHLEIINNGVYLQED